MIRSHRFSWAILALLSLRFCFAALALAGEETDPASSKGEKAKTGVASALSGTSGVRVQTMCTNCNVANVTMCGQTGDRVQVWQDGLPVMGGLGAIYLLSVMPGQGIASTEVLRGAGTVLSGPEASVGAVVLHTLAASSQPRVDLTADFGGESWNGQKLLASGRSGNWGGTLVLTHAQMNGVDSNGDGAYDLGQFNRRTFGGSAVYDLGKRTRFRLDALGYREKQTANKGGYHGPARPIELGHFLKEDAEIERNEFGAAVEQRFLDGSRLSLRLRKADRRQDTSDNSGTPQPYMWVREHASLGEVRYERTIADRHSWVVGVAARRFEVAGTTIKRSMLYPDGQRLDDITRHQGAFSELGLALPNRVDLTLGLRWDTFTYETSGNQLAGVKERSANRLLPRLRIGWKATPTLGLALAAGDGLAVPRPVFERVCCGALVQSNTGARPEISRNFLLDLDFVPKPWFHLRGTLFRNEYTDYLQKTVAWVFSNYIPSYEQVNFPDVVVQGVEIATDFRFMDRFSAGLQFSRLHSDSRRPAPILLGGMVAYELAPGRLPYLADNQGSVSLKWSDKERGFEISAQAQYTGGMLIQRLDTFFGPADVLAETPSFWTVNVRGDVKVWRELSLFVGVDNLTDKVQLWLDDPRYEYNWGQLRGRYLYGGVSYGF